MQSGQEVKYKISSAVLVLLSLLILCTGCSDSHYNRIIWSNPKGIFNQEIDEDVPLQSFSFLVLTLASRIFDTRSQKRLNSCPFTA